MFSQPKLRVRYGEYFIDRNRAMFECVFNFHWTPTSAGDTRKIFVSARVLVSCKPTTSQLTCPVRLLRMRSGSTCWKNIFDHIDDEEEVRGYFKSC